MDQCQIDGFDELKIPLDVHHETNIKSIKNINIKKNTSESDHRTPKRKNDISNLNTLKKKKKYETALAAIFPENDQSYSQYAQDYAEGYMRKMKERLDTEAFDSAIKLLTSFGEADDSNINLLYQQLTKVFTNKNEDLIYEFLGFLLPGQALSIRKFNDYLELTRIKEFLRKLQVCMKKQPSQVRKILDNLFHLSKNENITALEVHTSMFPLLKSNPILVDCFFQLIPTERPPESFFPDDNWEDLDIDQSINCGIDYEEIIPSDSEDHTLLNICQCMCHKPGDNTHCTSCGLKFFKGRIYFDTPEGLKLAKISFEGTDPTIVQSKIDKTEVNITVKRKNRKSLIKNSSPGSAEDIKGSTGTESEEDLIDVKLNKRQKSKVVQSLKLKFKKEENPKCKEDQATCNETGKSIVHVTNEELNSSEMVFFCIPKAESSVKFVSKKKLKVDVKENLIQKQIGIINKKNSEISNLDNSNLVMLEKSNGINTEDLSCINNDNDILNEIKTEINLITPIVTIDNVQEIDSIFKQHEILKKNEMELTSQSSVIKNDFQVHGNSSNDMHQNNSNELNKHIIKNKFIEDNKNQFVDQNISTKLSNNCYFSSTTTSINDINKALLDKNIGTQIKVLKNSQECYVDVNEQDNDESVTTNLNESLLDKNIVLKSEFIKNLTELCVDGKQDNNEIVKASLNDSLFEKNIVMKREFIENLTELCVDEKQDNNEIVKASLNDSLFEKNIIIKSEFIENLTECVDEKKQDNNRTVKTNINDSLFEKNIVIKSEFIENLTECVNEKKQDNNETVKTNLNESLLEKNIVIKSEVIENLPECYADGRKQDTNESEKQQINKWTIDEDKIILQTCKRVEDIEVLLETINRRIPQRSVSEIQERFTTLMTLLEQMVDVK